MNIKNKLLTTLITAVSASMQVVRAGQGPGSITDFKPQDGSLVTPTDKKSENAAKEILIASGISVNFEEQGRIKIGSSDLEILYDGLDGTKPFSIGSVTSTVIAAVYDTKRKRVVACVIGEPISGRIWFSEEGKGTKVFVLGDELLEHLIESARECKVWEGSLGRQSIVFADFYPGFKKPGFENLPDTSWGRLFAAIYSGVTGINMLGSNGAHYALLANGGQTVAGVITSAFSGPWDVAPILAVIEAGGFAQAFKLNNGELENCDPLDPLSYQFAIAGNTEETVRALASALRAAAA